MGTSHGDFVKYPRTPHLFGSSGTDDDKHLSAAESIRFLADPSLIVEEKIDGTNVGIHFAESGALVLSLGAFSRLRSNPFFDVVRAKIAETLARDEQARGR